MANKNETQSWFNFIENFHIESSRCPFHTRESETNIVYENPIIYCLQCSGFLFFFILKVNSEEKKLLPHFSASLDSNIIKYGLTSLTIYVSYTKHKKKSIENRDKIKCIENVQIPSHLTY